MTFNEVIGQDDCKARLVQMVSEGRLPHAIMLCGPQGVGKLALATAFGCYIIKTSTVQQSPAGLFADAAEPLAALADDASEPAMLANLQHPDLHFTYPTIKLPSMSTDHKPVSDDFAREWHTLMQQGPYFSVDQWLDAMGADNQQAIITAAESDNLVRKLSLKSSQGGYKVSIIWLPERMNQESANKLLKLIEEPPRQTVFIMVSEEPERLLETIRSRVQRIDVKRLPAETIARMLTQRRGIDADMAQRVARVATGSWLRALQELQAGTENEQLLDLFMMLMRQAYRRDVKGMKAWTDTMAAFGREKQKRFLGYCLHMVRESFMYNFHQQELNYMSQAEENFARNFARFINEANVMAVTDLVARAIRDISQNANAKIVFYHLAVQMTVLLLQK